MGWGPVVWESTGIPFTRGSQESKPPGTKPPINHKLKNRPCLTKTYKNTRNINIFLPSIFRALCYVCFKEGKLATKTNMLDTTNYSYRNNSKASKKNIKKPTILLLYIYSLSISRSKNSFPEKCCKQTKQFLVAPLLRQDLDRFELSRPPWKSVLKTPRPRPKGE